jgi:hypothetical protein
MLRLSVQKTYIVSPLAQGWGCVTASHFFALAQGQTVAVQQKFCTLSNRRAFLHAPLVSSTL